MNEEVALRGYPQKEVLPDAVELDAIWAEKYARPGWAPRMRKAAGYVHPDDHYESIVNRLVRPGMHWCDVGCGRMLLEWTRLAERLAARAGLLFGIDPDATIRENKLVHEYSQTTIEDCVTPHQFDVITMRMVAEHVTDPAKVMRKIASMLKPGGHVVIFTPHRWTPMALVATLVPFRWHNTLKALIWQTEAKDTFPTAYRLNTRADLLRYTSANGLREVAYQRVDDCRILQRFKLGLRLELALWRALRAVGLGYPEACILAVYRKED